MQAFPVRLVRMDYNSMVDIGTYGTAVDLPFSSVQFDICCRILQICEIRRPNRYGMQKVSNIVQILRGLVACVAWMWTVSKTYLGRLVNF